MIRVARSDRSLDFVRDSKEGRGRVGVIFGANAFCSPKSMGGFSEDESYWAIMARGRKSAHFALVSGKHKQ